MNRESGTSPRRGVLPRHLAFANAGLGMILVTATVGASAPLLPIYGERFAISIGVVSVSYGLYIISGAAAMLLGGRLSDYLGRRAIALVALGGCACASVALVFLDHPWMFLGIRTAQGIATGLGLTAMGSFVIDLRRPGKDFLASLLASSTPMLGVAIGAVLSGVMLDESSNRPGSSTFWLLAALLVCTCIGVVISPETVNRPTWRWHAVRPALVIPVRLRATYVAVASAFVATWALGAMYQTLGPAVATESLGRGGALFSALMLASMLGFTVVGGPLTSSLSPHVATIGGLTVLSASTAGILTAVVAGSVPGFFVASAAAGLAFGAVTSGSMRELLSGAAAHETAGLVSAVYFVSYVGTATSSLSAGRILPLLGLDRMVVAYCSLVVLLSLVSLVVFVGLRRSSRGRAAAEQCQPVAV